MAIPADIASLIFDRLRSSAAVPDRQPHDERFYYMEEVNYGQGKKENQAQWLDSSMRGIPQSTV
jgi:hypothetical protein